MNYITGDTHGDFKDLVRFCKKRKLTENDTVIVLGDAGINYFGDKRDKYPRNQLRKTSATIFCIHGNHEMRPQGIDVYREMTWHGGTVYVEDEYPNILFAKDGEVYDFGGLSAIAIGGAYSVDKKYRLERGLHWFADEQPDQNTKNYVESQLEKHSWKIDIVLSHTAPIKYEPTEVFLPGIDQSKVDKTTEQWLDSIEDRLDYQYWCCGHYHTSKRIDKMRFMFHDFDKLPPRIPDRTLNTSIEFYDYEIVTLDESFENKVALQ